jgi:predicted XRE-type DNA-binding protein
MKEKITTGSGNVFADLGFSAEEAVVLGVRSQLMCDLELLIAERG